MTTIVGILTFMSMINFFVLSLVEYEKKFMTLGPVSSPGIALYLEIDGCFIYTHTLKTFKAYVVCTKKTVSMKMV